MDPAVKKSKEEHSSSDSREESSDGDNQQLFTNAWHYDVLRIIFNFLSFKDLLKAAQVCRSWRDAAINETKMRSAPEFKRFEIDNRYQNLKLLADDLRIKPRCGLIFTSKVKPVEWTYKGEIDCFCNNLPPYCRLFVLGGYDIVANGISMQNDFRNAVCAFLPRIPSLRLQVYNIPSIFERKILTNSEKFKCILMLTSDTNDSVTKSIAACFRKKYKPGTIALWGGVCTDLKQCISSSELCFKPLHWTAICLSSPRLHSWSIVLSKKCESEEQMEKELENFKNNIQIRKHSLGLMFACIARLRKKDLEISVFKRTFPTVPLVGLYGDGEYGLNTLNQKQESKIEHAYTTIFLILTYD